MTLNGSDALHGSASRILEQLTDLLDGGTLAEQIDAQIDRAFHEYGLPPQSGFSHEQFHQVTAEFIKFLYEKASLPGGKLTLSQAHDEAIAILGQFYQGTHGDGYHGAVLDASDPEQPGISLVLFRMADVVKTRQRQKYTRWVVSRHIDPADWHLKRSIAELLIERNRELLPPEIVQSSPGQWADHLTELLTLIQEINYRPG